MKEEHWMQLYLQAWHEIHNFPVNNFKHGIKFGIWQHMWDDSEFILNWFPPITLAGYVYFWPDH